VTLSTLFAKMNPQLGFRLRHHLRQVKRMLRHWKTYRLEKLKIKKKTVLIVDNAETLSIDQMKKLVQKVNRQGGKLVLVQGQSASRSQNTAFHAVASQLAERQPTPASPKRRHTQETVSPVSSKKQMEPKF
jgi:hypothetical protein